MEATSGALDNLVSLPGGGGALGSLGERFQPDLLRGTGNYAIPIDLPRGQAGLCPSLRLSYSTGQGNGPFGMGWQLAGPFAITRRTDRGVPFYDARDEFTLGGADLLVPVGGDRYRVRSDTSFWRIRAESGGWTIRTKEGRRFFLGLTPAGRLQSPAGVFCWLAEEETDAHGNAIRYRWEIDQGFAYLAAVEWSIFALRFHYEARPDPVFSARAGFPQVAERRCARIERHCLTESQSLVARHRLRYEQSEGTNLSLLAEVALDGIAADLTVESYPSVRLTYTELERGRQPIHRIRATATPPPSLRQPGVTIIDMNGDGLPDILETDSGGHRWWQNRGDGSFGPVRTLATAPAGMNLGRPGVTLADLDGDGSLDMLRIAPRLGVAVMNTAEGRWAERPVVYSRQIPTQLTAVDSRLVDLDGDGVPDLLQSTAHGLLLTYNLGERGWSETQVVSQPALDLGARESEIADMTGDGLSDLVFVASGRVQYWPQLGRGRWGAPVTMRMAPVLPPRFDRERLYLIDLDGDGAADLLYVGHDRVSYWLNQSGRAWSPGYEIPFIPPPGPARVTVCDFLGTGAPGILWSTQPTTSDDTGYRFLPLATSTKPYLLHTIDDGFGGLAEIAYSTSTATRSADEDTYLPFPLQVVDSITHTDRITGVVQRTHFRYHRGHYDGHEREFRGFERVEQIAEGDAHSPAFIRESIFDQGAAGGPRRATLKPAAERARERALAGSLVELRTYEQAPGAARVQRQQATMQWEARVEFAADGRFVHFPHLTRSTGREMFPGGTDRVESAEYSYDEFGNVTGKTMETGFAASADPPLRSDQRIAYVRDEAEWIVGLPSSIEARGEAGQLLKHDLNFYDARGVLKRTSELVYLDDALPPGYADAFDPSWGLVRNGAGWYRDSAAYEYDAQGNVILQTDAMGFTRTVEYDANGLFPLRMQDPAGLITECTFDPRSTQPLEVRLPDGRVTQYRYSPLGRLRTQFDTGPDGSLSLSAAYRIDFGDYRSTPIRVGRMACARPNGAHRPESDFAEDVPLESIEDAVVECAYYDAGGQMLELLLRDDDDEHGAPRWMVKSRRAYGAFGRPSGDYPNEWRSSPHFVLPSGTGGIRFHYDGLNQVTRVDRADGTRMAVRFLGDRIEKRDASVADGEPCHVERHDAHGQMIAVEEPDGSGNTTVTRYERSELGRLVAIHDASGRQLLRFVYAGPAPPIRLEHADAGTRTYWRDARASLRSRVDSLGRRLVLEYDLLNRPIRAIDASDPGNPVEVRSLIYDEGRLQTAVDGAVRTSYVYDTVGHVTRTTAEVGGESLVVDCEYRHDGQLTAMVYPDGTRIELTSTRLGQPATITGVVDRVDYDEYGSPLAIAFSGGPALEYAYDDFRRIERAALRTGAGILRELAVGYDVNGRIVSLTDRLPGQTLARRFTNDALHRITRAEVFQDAVGGPLLRDDHYAYTATGDLLRKDESLAGPMVYGDPAHTGRLTSFHRTGAADSASITYDDGGRVTAMEDLSSLRYDLFDRLVEAVTSAGVVVRFDYDHNGTRIRKQVVDGAVTRTTLTLGNLFERSETETRLHFHLGPLLVAAQWTPAGGAAERHYLLTDHLGSVLAACDAAGAVKTQQVYSPFGLPVQAAGTHDRYIGLAPDGELGLTQFGARYYSPVLGRFITPDWYIIENPNKSFSVPQGLNAYSYAINQPLALRDPSGLWFGMDDLIAAGIGFGVGFITGVVHGLANGDDLGDALLNGLEGGLLGAAGAWLAWNTFGYSAYFFGVGFEAVGSFSLAGWALAPLLFATGGLIAGLSAGLFINAFASGAMEIYDWSSGEGWLKFAADYSLGAVGTALGGLLIATNSFWPSRQYREDLSHRQNRHVYDGGFGFGSYAFTQGNVTSNMHLSPGRASLLEHEKKHTFQSRVFGPLFQASYVVWLIGGGIVGMVVLGPYAKFVHGDSYWDTVFDVAYHDNPWETWAYCKHNPTPGPGGRGGRFSYAC